MQAECGWFSGANENMVWEGMHDVAQLEAGVVTIHITVADVDGSTHPSQMLVGDRWAAVGAGGADVAERNIDAVMLNPNTTDIELRLRPGGFCPESWALCFDSLLSQAGEVFARLTSMSSQALSVVLPRAQKRDGFQVIRAIGAEGLDRRGPAGSCRLFLGPGFRLGARWNCLVETVKTRKK